MLSSLLEEGAAGRCFQVYGFVETGVATDEGFIPLAVLLERRESEADAWVFDWTNLRLSHVGAFPNGEVVQVEVVDPGHRALLVSSSSARSRRGIVFVPNRRESSGPHDAYVPASECLVLHNAGVRPWWRTEMRIEAQTGSLVVDYIGVDTEPFHQDTVPWSAEEQRYTFPDRWLSRELSTRRCFFPHAAAPDAS